MLDTALRIIIFMYVASWGVLIAQYYFGDVMGEPLVSPVTGEEVRPAIIGTLNRDGIRSTTQDMTEGNYNRDDGNPFSQFVDYGIAAAFVAWDLISIIAGLEIFWFLMGYLGLPMVVVAPFMAIYLILLGRAIVGYIRGV